MSTQTLLLIAGMMLVTYLPRALPAAFLEKIRPGARAKRFLEMIPYTAMAALIFPGILSADPQRWYVGLLGGGMAALLAAKKVPVALCVLGAVGVVLAFNVFLPA